MTNMWDAATLDYEQERLDNFTAAAIVATAEHHGFVIQASSKQEFEDRLALVASAVENTVGRVTYTEPGSFPAVHQAVLASWERDFDLIVEQRQIETQRRNARRAYFRRQGAYRYVMIDTKDGSRAGNFSTLESALRKVEDSEKNWGAPKGRYRIKDRQTGQFVDPLTAAGSRKVAWTEDESDVTPMARKLMQMTDDATDVDKWNYGPEGYRDEVETALVAKIRPLLSQITQADIDCLEDYNFHVTNRAIERAKGRTASNQSLRAFGALSCPQCKADVSTGAKIFDHGDHEVLKAKCESCGWSGSKKKQKKSAGFKVVDDSSGASTGTVYPNKEIAEQANYGDGYSVQYTDEKVKTAKVAANWQRQQDGPGESHWHLTPSDFRPGQWAKISPVGDGFMLSIYAADGGDYTPDSLLLHERYETIEEAKEAAEHWRKTASLKTAKIEWGDVGLVEVNTYNGLTEKVLLWVAEEMGVTADIITLMGGYSWYVHSADNPDGSPLAEGQERTLERAKAMAERAMMEHSTQMSLFASRKKTAADRSPNDIRSLVPGEAMGTWNVFRGYGDDDSASSQLGVKYEDLPEDARAWLQARASKTAGENPFAKKDDEKKAAPKDDTTDSDADGEQDGPTQPGEQPEPKGDDQQAAPADPAAPQQDPAKPDVAQDKGQAQDPASAADTTQDQQQPADPTVMDVGQSTNMGFTMVDGGSTGSIEVTFVREENGVYFFNGPTGEFGVGQMNGQWQDADGNTFTFGGAPTAEQGIGPAQEQAAAADAATPTPTPAGNAQQPAPAAPADPNAAPADPQQAPPAQDAPPADDSAKSDDSGGEKKDDGEKKENPFAKKGD